MRDDWYRAFETSPPPWIEQFADASEEGRAELLWQFLRGAADVGHLRAETPSVLLVDWLLALDEESDLAMALDVAGQRVFTDVWRGVGLGNFSYSEATVGLLRLVRRAPRHLSGTVTWLHQHVADHEGILAARSPSAKVDAIGEYLTTLAATQGWARELENLWWRLCRGDGFRMDHVEIGVIGLRGLPPTPGAPVRTPPDELVRGVVAAANYCAIAVEDGIA